MPGDVTQLLSAIDSGDSKAAEELLPLVYQELRRLAAHKMANEKPGQTLQATALVHEAWIRVSGGNGSRFVGRKHFFKAAAMAMQHFLIDNARRKQTARQGGGMVAEPLHESRIAVVAPSEQLLAVHEAMSELEREAPLAAEIVRLRYFVGMSVPEIAVALELAPRTVDRHWAYARAWLKRAIRGQSEVD
ncbi:MAG: sigma-70 family RNA polymerase sigma factor [Verrucomicrobia bacterium]|nr:sigma-70 family RNA polymerase sigma factor [Verrucomicrobiota bacterium]